MLRASINMKHSVFVKIARAAVKLHKTRREIVIMLLRRILRDMDRFQGGCTLVRYQPRDPRKQWHCFPMRFRKNENEFATGFRKLGRFSLSYLVAIAAESYLEELLRDPESGHNYSEFSPHVILKRTRSGILCWELCWGEPPHRLTGVKSPEIFRRASPC